MQMKLLKMLMVVFLEEDQFKLILLKKEIQTQDVSTLLIQEDEAMVEVMEGEEVMVEVVTEVMGVEVVTEEVTDVVVDMVADMVVAHVMIVHQEEAEAHQEEEMIVEAHQEKEKMTAEALQEKEMIAEVQEKEMTAGVHQKKEEETTVTAHQEKEQEIVSVHLQKIQRNQNELVHMIVIE
jgi:hypothetical protein